jgi:hypothetical protein
MANFRMAKFASIKIWPTARQEVGGSGEGTSSSQCRKRNVYERSIERELRGKTEQTEDACYSF